MQNVEHLREHTIPVRALLGQMAHRLDQRARVTFDQRMQHTVDLAMIQCAQHGAHIGSQHLAFTESDGLVGQAHGVAHRAIGGATQKPQRIVLERHVLGSQHVGQVLDHPLRRHVLQGELQAARQHGDRQLLRVGGGEQKFHMGRRLFQGLQQGVEGTGGEHVHFVDQIDLEAPAARRVLHVVEQLTGVFDLGAAGRVHFDQIDETPFVDFPTYRAGAARGGADAGLAVQALGDNPRNGGLAHTAGTGEQVGVVQALAVQGVDQGFEHMGLADHFAERARTPFTCKNLITHGKPSCEESKSGLILAEQPANCIRQPSPADAAHGVGE